MLTPICASWGGWQVMCAIRVVEGFSQGFIFPSTHALLAKWCPIIERAQLTTIVYSGSQFGTVLMLSISGVLASSSMGWPSIFYFSGAIGGVWAVVWFFCGSNSPSESTAISATERALFEEPSADEDPNEKNKSKFTPWIAILTSVPFWALLIVHCAHNWGFWTLLTKMPAYMKNVLGMDIKSVSKNKLFLKFNY